MTIPTSRQVDETVDLALRVMSRYQDGVPARRTGARMRAEVWALAAWVDGWSWDDARIEGRIIGPLDCALTGRFGTEVGHGLLDTFLVEFARAFVAPARLQPGRRPMGCRGRPEADLQPDDDRRGPGRPGPAGWPDSRDDGTAARLPGDPAASVVGAEGSWGR